MSLTISDFRYIIIVAKQIRYGDIITIPIELAIKSIFNFVYECGEVCNMYRQTNHYQLLYDW